MNIRHAASRLKLATVALVLTVAAAALSGCTDTSAKSPDNNTPTTSSSSVSTQETVAPTTTGPTKPVTNSLWAEGEVTVLNKTTDKIDLTATIWDGKYISGPTPHPSLGGGDFTITADGKYDSADWIVVPFRIEAKNVSGTTRPSITISAEQAAGAVAYVLQEGVDSKYTQVDKPEQKVYIKAETVEPGQKAVATGYILMPAADAFVTPDSEIIWVIAGGVAKSVINANIVYDQTTGRFAPRSK